MLAPRLVIAGTHSGVGKTTVATGLMAALRRAGLNVASAKVGPDFIDPGYHHLATGRVGRNLDSYLCGPEAIVPIASKAAEGADLLVVEGVMGLFDGLGSTPAASTAEIAALLEAPVVLVADASSMSSSVRALVDGSHHHLERTWSRPLAGVILNRVGSDTHETLLREAMSGSQVPVLGVLRRDGALEWRDRHLGLVPVVENPSGVAAALARLVDAIAWGLQLGDLEGLARRAPAMTAAALPAARRVAERAVKVAVMGGAAFGFSYPDNLERLAEAGAELVEVDPVGDPALPDGVHGLYACGGFPEVFAPELAANRALLGDVRQKLGAGLPTWAECGGLLWLSRSLDGHRLCGAIAADARLAGRVSVGYRSATLLTDTPIGERGTVLRGHEHHYSTLEPAGDALELVGRSGTRLEGWATERLLATYLHLHMGGDPSPAEHFVALAADHREMP
ncbi:MAG: cobyrinate a,c-diamide synthase [Acidimicrobiales bacterium]